MNVRNCFGLLTILLLCVSACQQGITIVPVSGRVLIDGEPLTHGVIMVTPSNHRPAMATLRPDGSFTLTTHHEGDGVAIGTHPVAIIAHETLSPSQQRWHAPKKYMSPDTSGLTITIDRPRDDLVIELTWQGSGHKGPYVERQEKEN